MLGHVSGGADETRVDDCGAERARVLERDTVRIEGEGKQLVERCGLDAVLEQDLDGRVRRRLELASCRSDQIEPDNGNRGEPGGLREHRGDRMSRRAAREQLDLFLPPREL